VDQSLWGVLALWRDAGAAEDNRLAPHGSPSRTLVRQAVLGPLRELILPGFCRFGVAVAEAERCLVATAERD
jgi:hypothetical protein